MAAVVALATVAGALGGALATAGLGYMLPAIPASPRTAARWKPPWRGSMPISLALKASVEHTSKIGMSQFNKTSDRLDKVEKAQAEPAAKLAKLSEAVDKLRAAPPARLRLPQSPAAAKDVTGSMRRPQRPRRCRSPRRSPVAGCRRSTAGCCATSPMAAR